jgi:ankyrin repeat protein
MFVCCFSWRIYQPICKYVAAKVEYLNTVQYLTDGFAPIDRRNAKNERELLVAAVERNEKIVRVLIEEGAGIGVRDIEGKTALDIATDKGYTDITHLLKDRAERRKPVSFISHTEKILFHQAVMLNG